MKKLIVFVLFVLITLGASSISFAEEEDIPRLFGQVDVNDVNTYEDN